MPSPVGIVLESSHLPAANPQQESHNIGLLLLVEFFDIFEGTHLAQVSMIRMVFAVAFTLLNLPGEGLE